MTSNKSAKGDTDRSISTTLPEKFQLPPLLSLEPLTQGTSLPVPQEESSPDGVTANTAPTGARSHQKDNNDTNDSDQVPETLLDPTSPTSPRPGSVRRFLSKMSLSGSYKDSDSASITSSRAPMSPVSTSGMSSMDLPKSNGPKRTFSKSEKGGFFGFRRSSSKRAVSSDHTSVQAKRVALEEQTAKALAKDPAPLLPDLPTLETSLDTEMFRKF